MPIPVFEEKSHRYTTPGGKHLPGVTTILGEYIILDDFGVAVHTISKQVIDLKILKAAGEYGTAAHKVFELSLLHGIGSFDYPEKMALAVSQVAAFIKDYQPQVILCEQSLYSEKRLFAGTMDLYFTSPRIKSGKRLCLLDAKSGGAGDLTGPQTSAYEDLIREHTGEKGVIDRFKLQLPKAPGSEYKLIPLRDPADSRFFSYKLFVYNYTKK